MGADQFGTELFGEECGLQNHAWRLAVVFLRSSTLSWVLAVLGTAVTAVVTLLMHELSGPTYTWPYILTTWVFLVIAHYIPAAKRP